MLYYASSTVAMLSASTIDSARYIVESKKLSHSNLTNFDWHYIWILYIWNLDPISTDTIILIIQLTLLHTCKYLFVTQKDKQINEKKKEKMHIQDFPCSSSRKTKIMKTQVTTFHQTRMSLMKLIRLELILLPIIW